MLLRRIWGRIRHPLSRWNRLYLSQDPWRYGRDSEIYRFEQTNRIIREYMGPMKSMLEIGCAEGDQTEWLLQVAERVHGVDISGTAVGRAARKVPNATFSVDSLPDLKDAGTYDLVSALEILGYVPEKDIPRSLKLMEARASKRIISLYRNHPKEIDSHIFTIPGLQTEDLYWDGELRWTVAWW